MKQIFIILLLAVSISNVSVFGQANPNKAKEREVKVSGKYYYGEGLDTDITVSQKNAFDDLKLMILEAAMANNADLSNADFKGFESDIETVTFELEGRVKVLMYLAKSSVKFESTGNSNVFVIRNTDDGVDLVAQSPSPEKVITIQPVEPAPVASKEEEPKIITITSSRSIPAKSTPAPQEDPQAAQRPGTETPSKNVASATPPARTTTTTAATTASANVATRPTSQNKKADDMIINQLLPIRQYDEARQILNKNKLSGKLMYGQLATLSKPQDCYFLVLRDRAVVDILDKSEGVNRRSLLTGNVVDYRSVPGVILWICIL